MSFAVFCVYTFVLVGRPQDFLPGLASTRPALALTLVSLLVTVLSGRLTRAVFRLRATTVYLAFFGVMLLGIPFSIYPRASFEFVTGQYAVNVAFFLLFLANVDSVARLRSVVATLAITLLFFAAVGLGAGTFTAGRFFIATSMFDPNDISFVVLSLLSCAICVLLGPSGLAMRLVALAAGVSGVVLSLYTGSRGGLLGLGTFVLLFFLFRVQGVSLFRKVVVMLLLSAAALANLDRINIDRYLTLTDIEEDYNATAESGRASVWRRGMQVVGEHPLSGVGVTRFGEAVADTRFEEWLAPQWQAPHNSYLQVLAETGIVGAATFLLLLGMCLRTLMRSSPELHDAGLEGWRSVLLIGFTAQLATAFFLSQGYSMFLTLSFALATSLGRFTGDLKERL